MKITTIVTMTLLAGISPAVTAGLRTSTEEPAVIAADPQSAGATPPAQPSANDPPDLWQRAVTLYRANQFAAAAEAAKRTLAATRDLDPNSPQRAIVYGLLGDIYRGWGQACGESRADYARAIAIWEKQSHPQPESLFTDLAKLIGAVISCNPDEAAKLLRDRYRELQRFRSGPIDDAKILLLRAAIAGHRRHYAEAADLFRQALRIYGQAPGPEPEKIAEIRYLLADALRYLGHYQESLDEARRAIASFEDINRRHPSLPMALNSAACTLFFLQRKEESAQVFQRALDLARDIFGEDSRATAMIMVNYATVLRALKRPSEAQAMNRRGQQALERASVPGRETVDVEELSAGRR